MADLLYGVDINEFKKHLHLFFSILTNDPLHSRMGHPNNDGINFLITNKLITSVHTPNNRYAITDTGMAIFRAVYHTSSSLEDNAISSHTRAKNLGVSMLPYSPEEVDPALMSRASQIVKFIFRHDPSVEIDGYIRLFKANSLLSNKPNDISYYAVGYYTSQGSVPGDMLKVPYELMHMSEDEFKRARGLADTDSVKQDAPARFNRSIEYTSPIPAAPKFIGYISPNH